MELIVAEVGGSRQEQQDLILPCWTFLASAEKPRAVAGATSMAALSCAKNGWLPLGQHLRLRLNRVVQEVPALQFCRARLVVVSQAGQGQAHSIEAMPAYRGLPHMQH